MTTSAQKIERSKGTRAFLAGSPNRRTVGLQIGLLFFCTALAVALWTEPGRQESRLRVASLQELKETVSTRKEDTRAWYYLARRYEQLGLDRQALAAYQEVVRREDDEPSWQGVVRTLSRMHQESSADAVFQQFRTRHPERRAMDRQRWAEGNSKSNRSAKDAPATEAVLLADAEALRTAGQPIEALSAYHRILERNPGLGQAWFGTGAILDKLSRPAEAFIAYDKGLQVAPERADIQFLLADRTYRAGLLKEAVRRFREVVKADPKNDRAWYELGIILASAPGFPVEARDAFQNAVRLASRNALYRMDLAESQAELRDLDQAEENYRAALRLEPQNQIIRGRMGAFLAQNRTDAARVKEAKELLRGAVEAAPQYDVFRRELGHLLLIQGDAHQAIRLLEPLVKERPRNRAQISAWYLLAQAYKSQGNIALTEDAIARSRAVRQYFDAALAVREAAERSPKDAGLRVKLARLHAEAGEDAKALDQYRVAQRLAPEARVIKREADAYAESLAANHRLPDMSLFSTMVEHSAP